jgi:hypothetical protein
MERVFSVEEIPNPC